MRTHEPHTAAGSIDAIEIVGDTRQAFLLKATLAAAAGAGAAMLGPNVGRALGQDGMGDVEVLNYALTLEYLEAAFYRRARKLSLDDEARGIARVFGREEAEHVTALEATIKDLGGKPVDEPRFSFPIEDRASFLKLAIKLEDTGVSAYNGAATRIRSKEVLAAAGSIVQVEARHAAVIRLLAEKPPAPRAFDVASEQDAVVAAITPLIKG